MIRHIAAVFSAPEYIFSITHSVIQLERWYSSYISKVVIVLGLQACGKPNLSPFVSWVGDEIFWAVLRLNSGSHDSHQRSKTRGNVKSPRNWAGGISACWHEHVSSILSWLNISSSFGGNHNSLSRFCWFLVICYWYHHYNRHWGEVIVTRLDDYCLGMTYNGLSVTSIMCVTIKERPNSVTNSML